MFQEIVATLIEAYHMEQQLVDDGMMDHLPEIKELLDLQDRLHEMAEKEMTKPENAYLDFESTGEILQVLKRSRDTRKQILQVAMDHKKAQDIRDQLLKLNAELVKLNKMHGMLGTNSLSLYQNREHLRKLIQRSREICDQMEKLIPESDLEESSKKKISELIHDLRVGCMGKEMMVRCAEAEFGE